MRLAAAHRRVSQTAVNCSRKSLAEFEKKRTRPPLLSCAPASKTRILEVGTYKFSIVEHRAGEVGLAQISSIEDRLAQIAPAKGFDIDLFALVVVEDEALVGQDKSVRKNATRPSAHLVHRALEEQLVQ